MSAITNAPVVSVCIPTRNGERHLSEALESLLAQSYSPLEAVVSDDCSEDGTLDLVKSFSAQAAFPVRVFHHTPAGMGANWNNALRQARGAYVKFLFQDDLLHPECLRRQCDILDRYLDVALVGCKRAFLVEPEMAGESVAWLATYSNLQAQFESGDEITWIDRSLFLHDEFFAVPKNKIGEPSTVMFRRSVLDEVGFFDESLAQSLDYILWYRILKRHRVAIINQQLATFRIHAAQATNRNRQREIPDYIRYPEILIREFREYLSPELVGELERLVAQD